MNPFNQKAEVLILGAGIAGLIAGRFLQSAGVEFTIVESNTHAGGIASSFTLGGWTFDYGIHGLYTKNNEVRSEFREAIDGKDHSIDVRIADYWKGCWSPHPPILHLAYYPEEISQAIIREVRISRKSSSEKKTGNFGDWCVDSFGFTYCHQIYFPYIRKFWGVEPEELNTSWMDQRVKQPNLSEVIAGATNKDAKSDHYVKQVMYPIRGGFGAYADALARNLNIHYSKKVIRILPEERHVVCSDGSIIAYEKLISTLPLKTMARIVIGLAEPVRLLEQCLRSTSVVLVNIGILGGVALDYHWVYVFDQEIPFSRLSSPSNWSKNNAPEDCSSLQAECYFSGNPPAVDTIVRKTILGLIDMG
ncbi:MAG: FAD-dependent oxidoreductase, partial [Proteobacteria bacterium]|nr:FAD-dependent oxidoreductase [Pseudomonadota bacterium]